LLQHRLGNEFFSAKKFDQAILHYTDAINADPENAVYYSNRRYVSQSDLSLLCLPAVFFFSCAILLLIANHTMYLLLCVTYYYFCWYTFTDVCPYLMHLYLCSACFFSLKKWEAAGEDATSCIQRDSSFVKGYYRLALALTEQGNFDDACSTLLNACKIEPDNAQLLKQLRVVRAKKAALAKRESDAKGPQKELDAQQRKEVSYTISLLVVCLLLSLSILFYEQTN
jgi:tetratricopeptide (TPR) repeat protein